MYFRVHIFFQYFQSLDFKSPSHKIADFAILTFARVETKTLDNLDLVQTQMGVENEF